MLEFKSNGAKHRTLQLAQYFIEIQPCFKEIINSLISSNDTKLIQMSLKLLFISTKDTSEESDYMEMEILIVITGSNVTHLIETILNSLLLEYKNNFLKSNQNVTLNILLTKKTDENDKKINHFFIFDYDLTKGKFSY